MSQILKDIQILIESLDDLIFVKIIEHGNLKITSIVNFESLICDITNMQRLKNQITHYLFDTDIGRRLEFQITAIVISFKEQCISFEILHDNEVKLVKTHSIIGV